MSLITHSRPFSSRFLDEKRTLHERSLSHALRSSLEGVFVGRCFAFEFGGLRAGPSVESPSLELSSFLRHSGLGLNRAGVGHRRSLAAARIRQLRTTAATSDTTVLSATKRYFDRLEHPRNASVSSTHQGSVLYPSSQGTQPARSQSDSSWLLYQSVRADDSHGIALESYHSEDTTTSFAADVASTPFSCPVAIATSQLNNDSTKTSSLLVFEGQEDSVLPSVHVLGGLLDESSFRCLDTLNVQDTCVERAISTSPGSVTEKAAHGTDTETIHREESVCGDLEANEILQELISDWESTQQLQSHLYPSLESSLGSEGTAAVGIFTPNQLSSSEQEFSPSTLSMDFLTSFTSSFKEDITPNPNQTGARGPTNPCLLPSGHRTRTVRTPMSSVRFRPRTPGVAPYSDGTPELFSGSSTPYSLPMLSRLGRTGSSSEASPELFGSSKSHRPPFSPVVDSFGSQFARMPRFITPLIHRSQSELPRRNIMQDITDADHTWSGPAQGECQTTEGVATNSAQTPYGGQHASLFSSPDLF